MIDRTTKVACQRIELTGDVTRIDATGRRPDSRAMAGLIVSEPRHASNFVRRSEQQPAIEVRYTLDRELTPPV